MNLSLLGRGIVRTTLGLVLLLGAPSLAFAAPATPSITLGGTGTAARGDTVSINGTHFTNNATVHVTITGHSGNIEASTITVSGSSFVGSIVIPNDATLGSDTVTATDTSSNTASTTLTVKTGQTITVTTPAPASAAYNSTFPVAASASSGLTVAITTTGGCSISGGTVTMTSASTACVVNYNQVGNGSYAAATQVTSTTTATKATPTVSMSVTNSPVTYNGSSHTATISTTSSTPGATSNIKYGGSSTAPTNATTSAVTADFIPTDTTNYNSVLSVSAGNFVINKATPTPTLSVTNTPATYTGSGLGAAVSVTGGTAGSVSNILTGGGATQTNAGTYAVTADFTPTDTTDYNNASGLSAGNFVINQAGSVTVITCPATAPYAGGAPVTPCSVTVTGSEGSTTLTAPSISYSNNTNVGTATANATYAGDTNHASSTATQKTFSIVQGMQATLTVITPGSATYGQTGLSVSTTGGSGTGAVTYDATGSTACSVGTTTGALTVTSGTGTCSIVATKAADANYSIATSSPATIVISKATPSVTFSLASSSVSYTGAPQTASVTASSSVAGSVQNVLLNGLVTQTSVNSYTVTADYVPSPSNTTNYATVFGATVGTFTIVDTTAPVFGATLNIVAEATASNGANVTYTITATDNVDGTSDVVNCTPASGSLFPMGSTTVNCSVQDAAHNQATASFVVGVHDTTKPTITILGNTIVALHVGDTYTDAGATANDNIDGDITSRISSTTNLNLATPGTYNVTYNVSDNAGNAATPAVRTIDVSDVTAPVINVPANITKEATGSSTTVDYGTVTSTDNVDGSADVVTCNPLTNTGFSVGTTIVNCSATDSSSNTGYGSFNVTITDTTAPTITLNGSSTMSLLLGDTYTEQGATATDLVDGTDSVTVGGDTVDTSKPGVYVVTYNAVDAHGNHASQVTRTVTVHAATIITTVTVDNTGGGKASSGSFAVNVTDSRPTTQRFGGSSAGTSVLVRPGTYSVTENLINDYTGSSSATCSGTVAADGTVNCSFGNVYSPTYIYGGGNAPGFTGVVLGTSTEEGASAEGTVLGTSTDMTGTSSELAAPQILATTTATTSVTCTSLPNHTLGFGRKNDSAVVKLLQAFLNGKVGSTLPITGFFGKATRAAAIVFQEKYMADVLKSMGYNHGTGLVGPATLKAINAMCTQAQ